MTSGAASIGRQVRMSRAQALTEFILFKAKQRIRRRPLHVALLLYPGMTALDLVGPHEVLSRLPGARVTRVAKQKGPVETDSGLIITAEHSFADVCSADILFVPGATNAWDAAQDPETISWVRAIDRTTTWTTSVCTGALILGAAGLLKDREATTFWSEVDTLKDFEAVPVKRRVVRSEKYITGAGVSAGIDLALAITDLVAGRLIAQALQLGIEYDPDPPFSGGSPDKTPTAIVKKVRTRIGEASTRNKVSQFSSAH
jgi:transcriptional regulator GlxA family with amidase domain